MNTSRRGFLGAALVLGTAPAIVKAQSLMKIQSRIIVPNADIWIPAKFESACLDPNGRVSSTELPNTRGLDVLEPTEATYAPETTPWRYQWCADGVPIDGAINKTFVPRAEHAGKVLTILAWPANNHLSLL